ncbi:hypothetical protein CU560_14205 [Serratia ureilytica]|nr:hypothetical protein CU560_14205 [Serratia ureilytica]
MGSFSALIFFTRLVLTLIHNLCPASVRIERNDAKLSKNPGWELPLLWLRHHLKRQNFLLRVKWMRRHWLMTPFFTIWKGITVITMIPMNCFVAGELLSAWMKCWGASESGAFGA